MEPSGLTRRRIFSNCAAVSSLVCERMVKFICWPVTAGVPPIWPAEIWAFWAVIAAFTSVGVSL